MSEEKNVLNKDQPSTSPNRFAKLRRISAAAILGSIVCSPALAEGNYDTGASSTEIKIGQTMPYSGPASAYAIIGRVMSSYFRMLNKTQNGINGRKITLISLDDGFSPSKAVEQTRRLVEVEGVFAMAGSLGSVTNLAVAKYLNLNQVPQVLVMAGASKLDDPQTFPWTTTFFSSSAVEARLIADYILRSKPEGRIGVLYQNDDSGRSFIAGLRAGLGPAASMIVKEMSYDLTDPTADSQIVTLRASGADIFIMATSPKFGAQAIRKSYELGWSATRIIAAGASQIQATLKPAGLDASKGLITTMFVKFGGDPKWDEDPAMKEYYSFLEKWVPDGLREDSASYAYSTAQMIAEVLRRCGDDLTRKNLIRQATSIRDFQLPMFVPGVTINTSSDSRIGWRQGRMARFDGRAWQFVTDVLTIPEEAAR